MTNISKSFIHKMAAKTGWHRNETELRHYHPMYNQIKKSLLLSLQVKKFLKSVNYYLAKLQARTGLCRALSPSFSSVLATAHKVV